MRNFFVSLILFCAFVAPSGPAAAVPVKGSHVLISAKNRYATQAAQEIAEAGGNAVDMALTALLVMSVTNPSFGALGGGGFAVVKMGKKPVETLDFREVAPKKMAADYYLKKGKTASTIGGAAVGVPGLPAGIYELHHKYGKIHWSRIFDTAIRLAQKGFRVTGDWVEDTNGAMEKLNANGKKYFRDSKGRNLKAGDILKQPQLAGLLKELRNRKTVAFYSGLAAKDIVDAVREAGGDMELSDLAAYKPVWRKPLVSKFHGYTLYMMPPPSSGGVVLKTAFDLLDRLDLTELKPLSVQEFHSLIEVEKRAYRARALLGDPDFTKNPLAEIFSKTYLEKLAKSFDPEKATKLEPVDRELLKKESSETSHLSVLTSTGDAVAITFTLNGNYGSGVVTKKYGVALNNEMDDFTTRPGEPNMFGLIQGDANKVEPGKRPLSSMSPTLVAKGGKVMMAIGAPGGPRIISSVFQTIYRVLLQDKNMDAAIQAPRVHHQFLPDTVYMDVDRVSPEVVKALEKRGHHIEQGWQGLVYGVMNKNGVLEGAYDSRDEGAVSGF